MLRRHARCTLTLALLTAAGAARASGGESFSTLFAAGEEVTIYRDFFGVPHVFAQSSAALFEAYGYAVAQDRLVQLDLNRRAARGRLAEWFGAGYANTDKAARVVGYTDGELDGMFARLTPDEQEIFTAYIAGINRYIAELPSHPARIPYEYYATGFTPEPWTIRDSLAFTVFMVRRFGEIGGRELTNAAVLASLVGQHGPKPGYAIFDDVRWINDPDAPVTVPPSGAVGRRQKPAHPSAAQLATPDSTDDPMEDAKRVWESLGVPTRLGSYGWVVSAARSAEGAAMLYGGPQMGFSTPEVVHEVQLKGAGMNVTGMAFAGAPLVLIGRNDHVAWTSTTATGDNLDHYVETLCNGGAGYMFHGACQPFESRTETIGVRGGTPAEVQVQVLRTVHGPVVAPGTGVVFTQKRAHWLRELEAVHSFLGFDRARNLQQFADAVRTIPTSHNFFYADKVGNIAYWQAGRVPVRPAGFDARLPFPGDGSAEWPGGYLPIPTSVNPAQGFLANWNNKPSVDYDNADNQVFGKQYRLSDIVDRLKSGTISADDMRDIPKDIARVKAIGREARYLKPYLLAALQAVPPTHPQAAQARAVLETWDGSAFEDAVCSEDPAQKPKCTQLYAGEVIFSAWLSQMIANTFADELGSKVSEAGTNTLIHVLDFALTGTSGVPPSRDYLNGVDPNVAMSRTFDQILAALVTAQGPDPSAWTAPRGEIPFVHFVVGQVASIPNSNRSTYGQVIVLSTPKIRSENNFTLGQSGFIKLVPPTGFALDPHFLDHLPLYRDFEYKPMPLYQNTQLKE